MQQGERVAISAIAGMGGVGKTELALQYAQYHYQQRTYPGGVCWLQTRDANVGDQIVNFARVQLQLNPSNIFESLVDQVSYCWRNWCKGDVLVVMDDVTDYRQVKPYLPPVGTDFKVLITTRLQHLGESFEQLTLRILKPAKALELLEVWVGESRIWQELTEAQELCAWLGYLPLGLELVGRYLKRKPDLLLATMLQRLEEKRLEQRSLQNPAADMIAQRGVVAAFELSWKELSPIAQELGCLLSLFDLVLLPWSLIEQCFPETESEELEEARDEYLLNLHLIQHEGEGTYKLHELIREFFQGKLVEREQADSLCQAITLKIVALTKQNPYLVTEILFKKLLDWQWIGDITQLSVLEYGWQVRTATQAWMEGLGSLTRITLQLREDGSLPILGVSLRQMYADQYWRPMTYMQTGWNFSQSVSEEVIELPPESEQLWGEDNSTHSSVWRVCTKAGWNYFTSALLKPQASWAWQRTFEQIVSSLSKRLQERSLPVGAGYLSLEAAWFAAADLTGRVPFSPQPIPLDEIEERLSQVRKSSFSPRRQHCLEQLRIESEAARRQGQTFLSLPASVQNFRQSWSWSSNVLLAYAEDIYRGAVEGYEQLVKAWFTTLLPKLQLASILPTQLVGVIVPPGQGSDSISVTWFWEPLPVGRKSRVDFQLGAHKPPGDDSRYRAASHQIRSLYPQCFTYSQMKFHSESPLTHHWLGACPVTELVYQWLWEDLKRINWVKGELGNAGYPYWR